LAEWCGANAAAEWMRSMAMGALDPGGRAGGVAYLWLTTFAAGPALAVPREPLIIDRNSCVAFTGAPTREPGARLSAGALRSGATVLQRRGS
jgi:hypothetical protein